MALTDKLTAIADAIRAKTGKSDAMSLEQMVIEVAGIEGGGGDESVLASILDRSIEEVKWSNITVIGEYGLYKCKNITKIELPNLTIIGNYGMNSCSALKEVSAPKLTRLENYALIGTAIEELDLPSIEYVGTRALQNVKTVRRVKFGALQQIGNQWANGCTELKVVWFPTNGVIGVENYAGCTSLDTLVLGKTESIVTMMNVNSFTGTPFASGGTGGTVYVPQALISEYQNATNWSTLYAAGTCNFVAIEGSEYE